MASPGPAARRVIRARAGPPRRAGAAPRATPARTGRTATTAHRTGDTEAVRLLLEAGAEPNRPLLRDDGEPAWPALYAAVSYGCPAELLELLLEQGGDQDAAGPDGRSPYRLATSLGRADLTALLRRHGARDDATGILS